MPYAQEVLRALAGWQRKVHKLCHTALTNSMNVALCPSRQHQFKYPSRSTTLPFSDWLAPYRIQTRRFSLGVESDIAAREDSEGKRGPRNLILAVDRSKDSRYAVDWTIANICRPEEGDILHVVHIVGRQTPNVVGPDHSTAYMKFQNTPMNPMQEVKAERVRSKLAELYSDRMAAAGVQHEFHCLFQDGSRYDAGIGERICEIAEDKGARAVIVSAHRKSMLTEFLLGSTTNYLTHSCMRPVVVLHGPRGEDRKHQHVQQSETPRDLVVAVDASTTGEKLCTWTLNNIARPGDRVHALHVLPTMSRTHNLQAYAEALLGPPLQAPPSGAHLQQLQHRKHTKLGQRLHALMPSDGSVSLSVHVVAEDSVGSVQAVVAAICKHAQHLGAAALVVSSGTKGDVEEWLMGSITTGLVHDSETPVLVVT